MSEPVILVEKHGEAALVTLNDITKPPKDRSCLSSPPAIPGGQPAAPITSAVPFQATQPDGRATAHYPAADSGSVSETVVPWPGALSAQIVPPWASTIAREM